ncbi:hypothetical protein IRP63_05485 [Clostridium botulinum]|uniref:Uncharacterized protein n=1 Tax=Clostridium botulinum C/D str. DC5 TaxID=1443128 RepID=A0A0A0IL38_CLOBO|nr:hypothetical protein [Clostridium botulinum]KGN00962.1 hypothetical protein Z955_02335 [Clostridium botulinum C/D str. DC5]KOC49322.1 hypothetical protein ADU89_15255 [Clostridium botulinum]KOC51570.1 hypothetical protein ADU90_15170 [Clostridium botulinum]MCD3235489.1 hypothetical protein [Clostridium botulinum D/C]MCD3241439.1 hypothetical protein [Clostridium botulinum D/C]
MNLTMLINFFNMLIKYRDLAGMFLFACITLIIIFKDGKSDVIRVLFTIILAFSFIIKAIN